MLLEREQPLKQLLKMAEQSAQGRGSVVLLGAEAGMGKTSLLNAFREQWAARKGGRKALVLWGACDALFTPRPLGPLQDMAKDFSETFAQQLQEGGQAVRLYSALLQELEGFKNGVVLVIEDAHWADHATLDLLNFLGRRIAHLPVLLVISYRNDEVHEAHPLMQVFGSLPPSQTTRIELLALSRDAVESLGVPEGYSLDSLYSVTGGNPFFVTELLECQHQADTMVPASVKDAVSARLARLSQGERELLETLSVIPNAVNFALLRTLFGEQGETLAMACVGRNILVQNNDGSLRFRHELARLATLARVSSLNQKEFHGRVLHALLKLEHSAVHHKASLDQLVHHAAGSFDSAQVLEFAPRAANLAADVGAHREAAAHLATALRFVSAAPTELAAELYERWAYEAGIALRMDDEVLEAYRHAITLWRALDRPEKVGENLRNLSRLHWYRGEATEASHYADDAIRVLENTPPSAEKAMAYSLRSQLHMLNDRMDEAVEWGERAIEMAEEHNNVEVKIHALNNVGTARLFRNNTRGIGELRTSLSLAIAEGFHEQAARAYSNLSEYAVEFKDFELAEEILPKGIAFNAQYDLFAWSKYMLGRLSLLRLEQGQLADAEAIASGVVNAKDATLLMRLPALTVLAKTRLRMGEEDAYALLSRALSDALATGELQNIVPIRLGLIESCWLDDTIKNANEHLGWLNALGPEKMHPWRVGETAIWAARLQLPIEQDFYAELPEPYALEFEGKFSEAADAWEKLGLPYAAALALMQSRGSDNEGGAQQNLENFVRAQRLLEEMGARRALNKLQGLVQAQGLEAAMPKTRRGPYKAARNNPMGLTRREQQILAMMARGAQNRDIADSLSRSPRTIEHHVSSILAKLNASSRMEAMLRVQHEPWLLPDEL